MAITTDHLAEAHALGVQAAENAAAWVADGNTSATHIARVLVMFDEGDPAVDQYLPASPNLSGEWADDPTPLTLARNVLGSDYPTEGQDPYGEDMSALADAWEEGVSEAFESACETELRKWLDTPQCGCPDDCNCRKPWRTNFCGCREH